MLHLKLKIRQLSLAVGLSALALTVMSACTTQPTNSFTSAEDELRMKKAQERAERRDPPVVSFKN